MGAGRRRLEFVTQAQQVANDIQLLRGALQGAGFIALGTVGGLQQPLQHLQQQRYISNILAKNAIRPFTAEQFKPGVAGFRDWRAE